MTVLRLPLLLLASSLLIQGCSTAPEEEGFRTFPLDADTGSHGRPSRDAAPLRKLNPDEIHDAVARSEPAAKFGNHSPYDVLGQRYYVMPTARGYSETGTASWYGTKFQGQPTSTLEPYDLYSMTAAHKSLPLPTYVRVTNLDNGKSTVVRVNDRGPFVDDRIIDMSYAAAVKLGYADKGTARVKVEAITFADTPVLPVPLPPAVTRTTAVAAAKPPSSAPAPVPTAPMAKGMPAPAGMGKPVAGAAALAMAAPRSAVPVGATNKAGATVAKPATIAATKAPTTVKPGAAAAPASAKPLAKATPTAPATGNNKQIFLQAGAFADAKAAKNLQSRLSGIIQTPIQVALNDDARYRVHVGPFADENEARRVQTRIREHQIANPMLIRR